jgi:hypothetical protein
MSIMDRALSIPDMQGCRNGEIADSRYSFLKKMFFEINL